MGSSLPTRNAALSLPKNLPLGQNKTSHWQQLLSHIVQPFRKKKWLKERSGGVVVFEKHDVLFFHQPCNCNQSVSAVKTEETQVKSGDGVKEAKFQAVRDREGVLLLQTEESYV